MTRATRHSVAFFPPPYPSDVPYIFIAQSIASIGAL